MTLIPEVYYVLVCSVMIDGTVLFCWSQQLMQVPDGYESCPSNEAIRLAV